MRKFRPDVGDFMSDKAYELYRKIQFKAEHPGTQPDEADKCRAQLDTILERDKVPVEDRAYRRPGETDQDFKSRLYQQQPKKQQHQSRPFQGFSSGDFFAQRQRDFDLRDQQTKKYQEGLRKQQEFQRKQEEAALQAIAARLEIMRQQQALARQKWQQQSDMLHDYQPYEPTGPRPETNTEQEAGINWVFLFFMAVLIYYVFFK